MSTLKRIAIPKVGQGGAGCHHHNKIRTSVSWRFHQHRPLSEVRDSRDKEAMSKKIIYTHPNGNKYSIRIRKLTPRDCFRLMGVRDPDIDKLLAKEKTGQQIISNSKLYQLAGNSIVTNCMTAMFEELFYPSGEKYKDKSGQLTLF